METVARNVRDLSLNDRSAMERVIGHELRDTQQVIVSIVSLDQDQETTQAPENGVEVPAWWNVYEGLADDEIDRLDDAIRLRANLTRNLG